MTILKVKRTYEKAEKSDGFRVLVDRLWPRGIKKEKAAIDFWNKEISPSNGLRQWFNHETDKWDEFQKRYIKELENKQEIVNDLIEKIKAHNTTTFLFSSKEIKHNNAVALLSIISKKIT